MVALPAVCGVYQSLPSEALCCSGESDNHCSSEIPVNKKTDKSDCNSPCSICFSCQNCVVYFSTPPVFEFPFTAYEEVKKMTLKNDDVSSTYLSYCWNPPEIIELG